MRRLIVLTNSPGEIAGWVKPVLDVLASGRRPLEIILAVLPCPYASGAEAAYGATLFGVSAAVKYKEFSKNLPENGKNLILQLGGDPMFGRLLSRKMKCGWMIYTKRPKFIGSVTKYLLPDEETVERFRNSKVKNWAFKYVGNLVLDSIPVFRDKQQARDIMGLRSDDHTVAFLPGSRPFEYRMGAAYFARAAQELVSRYENLGAYLVLAPTVDEAVLQAGLKENGVKWKGEKKVETIPCGGGKDIKVVRSSGFAAIKASELAVAFPGTNNLQTAALGTPLLMVAPLNCAEEIPLDGIAGLIPFKWPGFRTLKKKLVLYANKRAEFVSLTNRTAGEKIVPEHRRMMTPYTVANLADELLSSPEKLREISDGYGRMQFDYGAARRIANEVEVYFSKRSCRSMNLYRTEED